ncbi:HAAS signaling domain-containing protein [Brevundimonas sp. NPDC092305]|uniref:HAAS signaling domain-containing protein n=1 Tax=Brevundimonas sp. NPDC092305 TaxID=3363957 RepID=UPI00380B9538
MDMLEKYLAAVAAQLPTDQRDDIIAELKDLILSRFEAKEEELGRGLTEDEREAILREVGHPLVVAARYRKGPDALIGPQLFPYWLFGAKAGLMILAVVAGIGLLIDLTNGSNNFGQDIAQAFHGFFGSALTLLGALTLAGAIMEHYDIRPKWLTNWRVSDLTAFNLSDPAAWGMAMSGKAPAKGEAAPAAPAWMGWRNRPIGNRWPGADYLFSFIAVGVFVLWWIGAIYFPFADMTFGRREAVVTGAPVWAMLHLPILLYALAQMAVDLISLARPYAVRMRAAFQVAIACAGLWLTWAIWNAGHWFNIAMDGETARVIRDEGFLNLEALKRLGEGGNADLTIWATNLSGIMTWVLVLSAFGLVCKILVNLWRLAVRPA